MAQAAISGDSEGLAIFLRDWIIWKQFTIVIPSQLDLNSRLLPASTQVWLENLLGLGVNGSCTAAVHLRERAISTAIIAFLNNILLHLHELQVTKLLLQVCCLSSLLTQLDLQELDVVEYFSDTASMLHTSLLHFLSSPLQCLLFTLDLIPQNYLLC